MDERKALIFKAPLSISSRTTMEFNVADNRIWIRSVTFIHSREGSFQSISDLEKQHVGLERTLYETFSQEGGGENSVKKLYFLAENNCLKLEQFCALQLHDSLFTGKSVEDRKFSNLLSARIEQYDRTSNESIPEDQTDCSEEISIDVRYSKKRSPESNHEIFDEISFSFSNDNHMLSSINLEPFQTSYATEPKHTAMPFNFTETAALSGRTVGIKRLIRYKSSLNPLPTLEGADQIRMYSYKIEKYYAVNWPSTPVRGSPIALNTRKFTENMPIELKNGNEPSDALQDSHDVSVTSRTDVVKDCHETINTEFESNTSLANSLTSIKDEEGQTSVALSNVVTDSLEIDQNQQRDMIEVDQVCKSNAATSTSDLPLITEVTAYEFNQRLCVNVNIRSKRNLKAKLSKLNINGETVWEVADQLTRC